tara:strand:- start:4179 stop:4394 length:216 start_codon:yes stop_codon:yes gene_type:complete
MTEYQIVKYTNNNMRDWEGEVIGSYETKEIGIQIFQTTVEESGDFYGEIVIVEIEDNCIIDCIDSYYNEKE